MEEEEVHKDIIDSIYESAENTLTTSGLILVKDFIKKWKYALASDELLLQNHDQVPLESITNEENAIPEELLEELFIVTSPAESLYLPGMKPLHDVKLEDVPEEAKLKTIKHTQQARKLKTERNVPDYSIRSVMESTFRTDENLAHKHARIRAERDLLKTTKEDGTLIKGTKKEIDVPEAIVELVYTKGQDKFPDKAIQRTRQTHIHMVTENTLASLRDVIVRDKEGQMPGDFSESPDQVHSSKSAADIFSSGMMFIEDTFYLDTRKLSSKDYSRHIVQWLRKKGSTRDYPIKSMQFVKIADMKIRLGVPYVYIHQGNCEHMVQFIDIRLVNSEDCQTLAAYPLQITQHQHRFYICKSCQIRSVRWMVVNSVVSPADPDHYCDICYKMLHYNNKGEKICDFKAYRYNDMMHSTLSLAY